MKTIRIFRTRGLILATVLGVSAGCASPAFAQNVVQTVIVNPDGKVIYLDTLGQSGHATDINDAGQVAGDFYSNAIGTNHAFITGPNGVGMTDLGTLAGINSDMSSSSYATGINDAGQVAGRSTLEGGLPVHAFITGPNGMGMTDLGTLVGPSDYSAAFGINNAGQVVGNSATGDGSLHAFITGPNGMGLTDLGTLGGPFSHGSQGSQGSDINDAGQVVGLSTTADGSSHAFITGPNGMGMTDLGTLGGSYIEASAINDTGQVVGFSYTGDGSSHAFITGPNGMGMTDLNSIVNLPRGGYLRDAQGNQ